jgi:hypothetical protein
MGRHNVIINNVLPGIFGTDIARERLCGDEYRGMAADEATAEVAVQGTFLPVASAIRLIWARSSPYFAANSPTSSWVRASA